MNCLIRKILIGIASSGSIWPKYVFIIPKLETIKKRVMRTVSGTNIKEIMIEPKIKFWPLNFSFESGYAPMVLNKTDRIIVEPVTTTLLNK
jgi:hypothetical protein